MVVEEFDGTSRNAIRGLLMLFNTDAEVRMLVTPQRRIEVQGLAFQTSPLWSGDLDSIFPWICWVSSRNIGFTTSPFYLLQLFFALSSTEMLKHEFHCNRKTFVIDYTGRLEPKT